MRKKIVYLCGPINGCTDSEANDWRKAAVAALASDKFHCLDPMRRDYRGIEAANVDAIVDGDIDDIDRSDFVLVAANRPTWGTAMEVFYAARAGKVVVTVCDSPSPSPWLRRHSTIIVPTLEDALRFLSYAA